MSSWFLYIVATTDRKLYTGVTKDVDRRVAEHNAGTGSKILRGKRPVTLLHYWCMGDRDSGFYKEVFENGAHAHALQAEAWVKCLPRMEKQLLLKDPELLPARFGAIFSVETPEYTKLAHDLRGGRTLPARISLA